MALMKTIAKHVPLVGTIDIPCYCKVGMVSGGKSMVQATMSATKDTADGEPVDMFIVHFVPNLDGPNFIAQAYAHFKALPQLAGATDC